MFLTVRCVLLVRSLTRYFTSNQLAKSSRELWKRTQGQRVGRVLSARLLDRLVTSLSKTDHSDLLFQELRKSRLGSWSSHRLEQI